MGIACAARGVIGFVGVDFVAHQDKDGLRLLAVDLNLRYTGALLHVSGSSKCDNRYFADTLAAFHMFAFLMGGQYDDLLTGRYFVDDRPVCRLIYITSCRTCRRSCVTWRGPAAALRAEYYQLR